MNLETERLFMRPVTARDGGALHRLHTDPLVVELIMQGKPLTPAESNLRLALYLDEWDRYGYGFWMLYLREPNGDLTFVGRAGLRDMTKMMSRSVPACSGFPPARGSPEKVLKPRSNSAFDAFLYTGWRSPRGSPPCLGPVV